MKKICLLLGVSLALLVACKPDNPQPEPEVDIPDMMTVVPYSFSIGQNEGCDPNTTLPTVQGGSSFTWSGLALNVFKGMGTRLCAFGFNQGLKELMALFSGPSEEVQLLNQVIDQLNEINGKLDQLQSLASSIYDKVDEAELNQIMADYQAIDVDIFETRLLNKEYFARLESTYSEDGVRDLIVEWKNDGGGPKKALSLVKRICEFGPTYNGQRVNFFAAFDHIIFNSYPWESQGYEIREAYRTAVAVDLLRALALSEMYYAIYVPTMVEDVQEWIETALTFIEGSQVSTRTEAVCQIKGAHVIIKPDSFVALKNFMFNPPTTNVKRFIWTPDLTIVTGMEAPDSQEIDYDTFYLLRSAVLEKIAAFRNSQLTPDEIRSMKAVYGDKKSISAWMSDGGLKMPNSSDLSLLSSDFSMTGYTIDIEDMNAIRVGEVYGSWGFCTVNYTGAFDNLGRECTDFLDESLQMAAFGAFVYPAAALTGDHTKGEGTSWVLGECAHSYGHSFLYPPIEWIWPGTMIYITPGSLTRY